MGIKNKLGFLLACIPGIVYAIVVYCNTANVPWADDYAVFLGFLNGMETDLPAREKLSFFFGLNNEHRLVTERLVCFVLYELTGELNFQYLTCVSIVYVCTMGWILTQVYSKGTGMKMYWMIVPVSFFLFSFNGWENMIWATGSLQNIGVFFFIFLGFFLGTKISKAYWITGFVCCVLAVFTSGNGLFALVLYCAYLIWKKESRIFGILFLTLACGIIAGYFFNYTSGSNATSLEENLLHKFPEILSFLLAYTGSVMYGWGAHEMWVVQVFGAMVLGITAWRLSRFKKEHAFTLLTLLLLLISAASAAVLRVDLGNQIAISSRYQLMSLVWVLVLMLSVIQSVPQRTWLPVTVSLLSVTLWALSLQENFRVIRIYKNLLETSAYCHYQREDARDYLYSNTEIARLLLLDAKDKGVYEMPRPEGEFTCK